MIRWEAERGGTANYWQHICKLETGRTEGNCEALITDEIR